MQPCAAAAKGDSDEAEVNVKWLLEGVMGRSLHSSTFQINKTI